MVTSAVFDMNTSIVELLLTAAQNVISPTAFMFFGALMLTYAYMMVALMNTDHTIISYLKMNVAYKKGSRPPVAPFGMFECIRNMTSDQQPWFPLEARKALNDTDTFVLPLPRRPVITGDFALAREILRDPLSTKPWTYQEFEPLRIGTIFTRNGAFWHARRKGVAPAFSNKHVKRMNQVALERTEKWIEEFLIPCIERGESFDPAEVMVSITLEAICETAFEYEISQTEKEIFTNNLELVFKEFLTKSINNPFRKFLGTWLPDRRRALQAARDNMAFAKRIIANYKSNPNPLKGTVIDFVVNNPSYANMDELAADVIMFLIGGHDTTAYTIAFTLLELARNPEEQTKIRDEVSGLDSVDEWRRSKALSMAVKESMRLYPVSASGSSRVCGRDFVTKEGWKISKGTSVVSHIMMTHRNKNVFGKDADEYVPSRWEEPTQAQKDSFLAFSAGKQNCVGMSLAQTQLHCIVARILSEFELEVEEEGTITWFLTMKPKGVKLRPKRAVR